MKAYQILSNPNLGKIFPQTLQSVQAAKHAHLVIEAVPDRLDIKCRWAKTNREFFGDPPQQGW